jgi:PmbA protein
VRREDDVEHREDPGALLAEVLELARRRGATAADALFVQARSREVRVRLGETEQVKESRSKGLGLRVFVGSRSATTSSSDLGPAALLALVERSLSAARLTAEDPVSGLPEAELFADAPPGDLDLYDGALENFDAQTAIATAVRCEDAARAADPRIINSEGAELSWGTSEHHLANSLGIMRTTRRGSISLWTTPVARDSGGMERDYWYTSARHLADLEPAEEVGRIAARRTLRRLGATKPETASVPVIFDPVTASRLLGAMAGAVSGGAIYRKASYLCGKLGEPIAAPSVRIVDSAHLRRGAGSKPYDGEGLATGETVVVDRGILRSYLLDCYSARKLGLRTTRSASRGLGGVPGPDTTNFWMDQGPETLESLIAGTRKGLLVTELIGFGVNTITGDYSQGAVGHWIEDGKLTRPVNEITIASTLGDMFGAIDGIANDRDPGRGTSAPSFRVGRMTVAGN